MPSSVFDGNDTIVNNKRLASQDISNRKTIINQVISHVGIATKDIVQPAKIIIGNLKSVKLGMRKPPKFVVAKCMRVEKWQLFSR